MQAWASSDRLVVGVCERDHGELVAGETRDEIGGSRAALEIRRVNSTSRLVAGVVPEGVVHLLEPIQVHHHDVAMLTVRRGLADRGEVSLERGSVREPGERIVARLELHLTVQQAPSEARSELIGQALGAVHVVMSRRGWSTWRSAP